MKSKTLWQWNIRDTQWIFKYCLYCQLSEGMSQKTSVNGLLTNIIDCFPFHPSLDIIKTAIVLQHRSLKCQDNKEGSVYNEWVWCFLETAPKPSLKCFERDLAGVRTQWLSGHIQIQIQPTFQYSSSSHVLIKLNMT